MTVLVALPVLLPLLAAGLSLVAGRAPAVQRVIGLAVLAAVAADAAALLVLADGSGPVVLQVGGHAPPFGIVLVADRLAALLLLVSTVVMLAVLVFSIGQGITEDKPHVRALPFHPMYLVLCAGVSLAYLTGDLFNLFVAFEMMLAASYVLITERISAERLQAGMTYVIVSLTSSMLFITLIGLVYAATGTVNLADLSVKMQELPPGVRTSLGLLAVVVFGIKAAIVPLHFWLPDSYPTAPAPITAVFAGLLTKVGVYALVRTQTLVFAGDSSWNPLLVLALLTMLVGVLGAIAQNDINRLLSFLLVSHIGYMLFGLGLSTVAGLTGLILYAAHHIIVVTTLFLVSGVMTRRTGTVSIRDMSGVATAYPLVAALFAIPALSLSGIPPFSGFVAKVTLLQAGVQVATPLAYAVTAGAVLTSLLTLYAMGKVWVGAFWGRAHPPFRDPDPTDQVTVGTAATSKPMLLSAAGLVVAGVALVVFAGPLSAVGERAAVDLLDGDPYRAAVLGEGSPR